jgi:hypothetical protein
MFSRATALNSTTGYLLLPDFFYDVNGSISTPVIVAVIREEPKI